MTEGGGADFAFRYAIFSIMGLLFVVGVAGYVGINAILGGKNPWVEVYHAQDKIEIEILVRDNDIMNGVGDSHILELLYRYLYLRFGYFPDQCTFDFTKRVYLFYDLPGNIIVNVKIGLVDGVEGFFHRPLEDLNYAMQLAIVPDFDHQDIFDKNSFIEPGRYTVIIEPPGPPRYLQLNEEELWAFDPDARGPYDNWRQPLNKMTAHEVEQRLRVIEEWMEERHQAWLDESRKASFVEDFSNVSNEFFDLDRLFLEGKESFINWLSLNNLTDLPGSDTYFVLFSPASLCFENFYLLNTSVQLLFTLPLFAFLIVMLIGVILLATYLFSPKTHSFAKFAPYECGFDPFGDARSPFDLNFYLVAILFLIFDLEVILLLLWVFSPADSTLFFEGNFFALIFFFIVLALGFLYEWYSGALDWASFRKKKLKLF